MQGGGVGRLEVWRYGARGLRRLKPICPANDSCQSSHYLYYAQDRELYSLIHTLRLPSSSIWAPPNDYLLLSFSETDIEADNNEIEGLFKIIMQKLVLFVVEEFEDQKQSN